MAVQADLILGARRTADQIQGGMGAGLIAVEGMAVAAMVAAVGVVVDPSKTETI